MKHEDKPRWPFPAVIWRALLPEYPSRVASNIATSVDVVDVLISARVSKKLSVSLARAKYSRSSICSSESCNKICWVILGIVI